MNVARLLQDSPSDDHRRRQEFREKQEREREEDREREFARERERERERERDRDRERAQRERNSSLSSGSTPLPSTHRPYSPLESAHQNIRSHVHAYDTKQVSSSTSRAPAPSNQSSNHAYTLPAGVESRHSRSYSRDSRPPPSTHSHSHSPPAPLFLSPLTAPRDGAGAGPVSGTALSGFSPEYSAEYAYQLKGASQQVPSLPSRFDQDRERGRAQSLTGTGRPRTPPYGDYRDVGRTSPTAQRLGHKQHSPSQSPYSVVPPPPPSHALQRYSPPLLNSLSGNNGSSARMQPSQGPPLSRRPPPPPSSLPPPPSASVQHLHDNKGAPTSSGMSRSFDELPYLVRAPSSSSSAMSLGHERTLKEDIEIERATYERERQRERDIRGRDRERERELRQSARSRSASAGIGAQANAPNAFNDRVGERAEEMSEVHRLRNSDASRAASVQGQPRDARERDVPRHHHHHLHHHHPLSRSNSYMHTQLNQNAHAEQQQQQEMQGHGQYVSATPYTYAHTGKPRISRSGVLKLAPPGVTVSNNLPPTSSDTALSGASGVVMRQETLTLAPESHNSQLRQGQHQLQLAHTRSASSDAAGPHPIEPIPVGMKQQSPPAPSLYGTPDMRHESSHMYNDSPVGYAEGPLLIPQAQQNPQALSKHKTYSVVPTGPGIPPPSSGLSPPADLRVPMIAVRQQQQQHAPQYIPPPPPQGHPSSSNGVHGPPHLHSSPYQHMPGGVPPQHQGYPHMHYNEMRPAPVPMALQSMPAPSPPMREPSPEEAPVHLGTYVFPRTPFPYFFSVRENSDPRRVSTTNISPGQSKRSAGRTSDTALEGERPTHITILVPSAHLPSSLPTDDRPRIWGGAPLSLPTPWTPFSNFAPRPPVSNSRRIYTDDSDLILCALHSGRISWNGIKRARAAGLDLSLRLALHRDVGRYVGGPSAFADGNVEEGCSDVDLGLKELINDKPVKEISGRDSRDETNRLVIPSASWDSGHDGSGIELLSTEWIPRGSASKLGLRNRSQRLLEYTERRRTIMKEVFTSDVVAASPRSTTVLGKRPTLLNNLPVNSLNEEDDLTSVRTIVFGKCHAVESVGFKYAPSSLRSVLFFPASASSVTSDSPRLRRKRRKLSTEDKNEPKRDTDVDGRWSPSPRCPGTAGTNRDVVLENSEERFLLAMHYTGNESSEDKENQAIVFDITFGPASSGKGGKGRKYDLYALPPPSLSSSLPTLVSPGSTSEKRSNGAQKPGVETPMTPRSNRSEPRSPMIAAKEVERTFDTHGADRNDNSKADLPNTKELASKPDTKASAMPTPPATTETMHPSSLPSLSLDTVKEKEKHGNTKTEALQLLYRDLGLASFQFLDNGLRVFGGGRTVASDEEQSGKGTFIHVDRWRWAGSRDAILLPSSQKNGFAKDTNVTEVNIST